MASERGYVMALTIRVLASVTALLMVTYGYGHAQVPESPEAQCDVTPPNGITAGREQPSPASHGNAELSTSLFPDGTVTFRPMGPGFVTANGSLGIKWPWMRGVRGQVKVKGRRLDAKAPRLRADIPPPSYYGDFGFTPSYLIFPTPGCWEVTAHVGNRKASKLTFVTRVVKIGEGPGRYDPPRR